MDSPILHIRKRSRHCKWVKSDSETEPRQPTPASSPVTQARPLHPELSTTPHSHSTSLACQARDSSPATSIEEGLCSSTPCEQSGSSGSISTSSARGDEPDYHDNVIQFRHLADSPWESQTDDSMCLDTSTPKYERGIYSDAEEDPDE